ncbi:MAG: sulfotransferase [Pseudomonadota bacterium]
MQTRTSPLDRTRLVDRSSAFLGRAWAKGWLPEPAIEAEQLWAVATKSFGDHAGVAESAGRGKEDVADFRLRLEKLTQSVVAEANLNPLGRAMAHGQLVRVIRTRLRMGAVWLDRPEMAETRLAPPIIIIGHMRSGTTRIHKLLAADPSHSHTRYCDAFHPVPRRAVDLREWKAAFEIGFLSALNPWLQSIHPVASTAVEEELGWLAGALQHSIYESQWRIPSYSAWSEARDAAPIYREFARILRTDAANRGNAHCPRVLKVPVFSENLPELLSVFPDARLILANRAREDVHRSAVSLVANQMAVQSDTCDLAAIEAEWNRKIALREERRAVSLRDWTGPIAHLQFDELNADWESAIARTYKALGLPFTRRALEAMQKLMRQSAKGAHAAHSTQLQEFNSA